MREFEIRVSASEHDAVCSVLDDHGIDYVALDAAEGVVLQFPLPTPAFDDLLSDLQEAGVDDDTYSVLTKAEFVETGSFDMLREEHTGSPRSLALVELHSKVREMEWPFLLYYVGSLLSVVVAAAGLLVDQPALVIGSMVVAPQVSSAISAPVGVIVGDWDLFLGSVKDQTLGLLVAVAGAAAFSAVLRSLSLVPPNLALASVELIGLRLSPGFVTTAGAFAAGVLSAFGFSTEQSMSLVGVMIAAALIPAAAVAGFAVSWGYPALLVGSTILLVVNLLAINLGVLGTLLAMGYYPEWYGVERPATIPIPSEKRATVLAVAVLVVAATGGAAYLTATDVAFSRSVNREVDRTLDSDRYEGLSVVGISSETTVPGVDDRPVGVVVTVRKPANRSYPNLPEVLERRIERRAGEPVSVSVRYGAVGSPGATSAPGWPSLADASDPGRPIPDRAGPTSVAPAGPRPPRASPIAAA